MILKKPNILYFSILFLALYLKSSDNRSYAQGDTSFAPASTTTPDSVRINNIFIVGNEKTRKSVILRELDFTTDFYYDWNTFLEILIADQKKIYNLRLFTSVEITPLLTGDDEAEILITVKERWYIVPQIIFQLADRNFSEWWTNQNRDFSRVNYGLRLSHSNVGGRNEKMKFAGQLGFTKALDLQYSKPYIDKNQKHGLAAQLTFKENKTIPIRSEYNKQVFFTNENEDIIRKSFAAALRYTYRRSYYNYHFLTVGYSGTWVSDDVLAENPNYFQQNSNKLRYAFATYTFRHDRRDNVSYATDGELLDLSITKYGIIFTEELDEVEINITANKYFKISDKFHFNTGLTADWFLSTNQPYTLVRGIGYSPNFVRGYELNVIEGQQLYVHKNSFRWKFVDWEIDISNLVKLEQFSTIPIRLYLSANFDHGYVKDRNNIPENSRLANKYLMGYGTGIDLIGFYDSVLRFEYSLNNSREGNFFFNFSTPF
ncbi:Surface antigen variable number repeat-containing protein [Algoriphagus locisalis]|uniref:Surface antigen variable number repeat-containing protein n=1 Tax=Algoriphagus locisalis TaxID=305507 RepID=A0A1I7BWT4_9BACT|nr:POTRA domain-containing protein [Algoriphagus locisalis]SFT91646.1 Surface antigen variable number repeat-containing protein [Algoriphagus locisalis]